MVSSKWIVHKFGGTSVAKAELYRKVAEIILETGHRPMAVVVSAMAGVTDALIKGIELAKAQDQCYRSHFAEIKKKHLQTVSELLAPRDVEELSQIINSDFKDIEDVLRGVWLSKSYPEQTLELISGYGEIWSAQILSRYLKTRFPGADWLNARQVLIVDSLQTGASVRWEESEKLMQAWLSKNESPLVVITGYVASTLDGIPTTLKRNGSDFSASIFGALLRAESIVIWTDVDGVLSADPRRVPEAQVLEEMSYEEAAELAYFGAKVLHPSTLAPAVKYNIPIWIKNTLRPEAPGTLIHEHKPMPAGAASEHAVKGFSTFDGVTLINVEGTGMMGVPGIAQRVFGALREVGVSVIMISQASSEHSICFAVPQAQGELARTTVEKTFFAEIHHGHIQKVESIAECSILAAVGEAMVEKPGVAGKFFGALGRAGVNVRAVAQGSSERNISAVIDRAQSTRALRAVHAAFYLSNQTISVGLIGPGLIGRAFLEQLRAQSDFLKKELKIDVRLRGIMNSQKMYLGEPAISLKSWADDFESKSVALNLDQFVGHIHAEHIPHTAILDCTASEEMAQLYPYWLKKGIHIITPNKKANSGPMELYQQIRQLQREVFSHYFYEATVGAGLPVITTLKDLILTGDRIHRIEGVFSGTLSYIFNSLVGEKTFSKIVEEAKAKGYTEPDPRDDLSGTDVARKLIILAREIGLQLELSDINIQSLVPEPLSRGGSVEDFMSRLGEFDGSMAELCKKAQSKDQVLRYVGVVDLTAGPKPQVKVELRHYSSNHSFARIQGTDNIIAFTTDRYATQPLIVQGPGAGPQVTAGGVFGDLLRLASYVGGR